MKVLHVITTISRGGAENHLVELIRHQLDVGFSVGVAWLKGTDYWKGALGRMGARLCDLDIDSYLDPRAVMRLSRIIRREQPALVHAHLPPAELCSRLALIGSGRRFVVSKHNDAPFYGGLGGEALGRWVARRAERMICISQAVADSVAKGSLGMSDDKVRCIRYCVDPTIYREHREAAALALRQEWGCDDDTVIFGCVARMVPQKDHVTLLRAFARLVGQAKARLVLVGDGPLRGEIKSLAARLGIADTVVFAGFHEDMPAVMNALDVACLTSLYEGFGLVLIEAMASGKPVLATRVSSIPEIVVNGESGVLVEKQDVVGLSEGMRRLLDRGTRERLGRASRERAVCEFSPAVMFQQTDALYAELGIRPVMEGRRQPTA